MTAMTASDTASRPAWRMALAAMPRWTRYLTVAVVLAALPVLLEATTGIPAVWYRIGGYAAVYAMAVLSLNLLMGYAGQISLGHTAFMAIGAYGAGLVTTKAGLSFVVGFMVATAIGALAALLVGLPALRLRGLLLAITTLGFLVVVVQSILQLRIVASGAVGATLARPEFGPVSLQHNAHYLAFLLIALVAMWALDANVMSSRLGRAFLGIREDEQVAASYGVDVARTKLLAFVLSGAMAGFTGAAYGHLLGQVQSTDFRLDLSLAMVAWVIIGGLGSRVGVVASGVLFGVFPFVFERLLSGGNVGFFAIVVGLLTATLGVAWLRANGRTSLPALGVVAGASIAMAGLFVAGVDPTGAGVRDFALIIGSAAFLITVAVNPNGFAGSVRERRDDAAAKQAKAQLRAGGIDTDDPTLPSLPVPAARHGHIELGTPVLEVRDVTVRFGGLTAVDRVSLTVPAGEIVGLIGPNGAGKTTLFDAIGGFNRPQAGTVGLLGRDLTAMAAHERAVAGLGRTFQRTGLAMGLSVRDNLLLAKHSLLTYDTLSALQHAPAVARAEADIAVRADEIISALGFQQYADLPVKYLSGGQRRIVEIACTLATAPDVLMLDEPTAGMAPAAVENLAERLRELRDVHDRTILLIEHHVPLVLDVCDHVYVMDHGSVIAYGTPDEILRDPAVLEAYLGERAARQAGLMGNVPDTEEVMV